MPTVTRGAGAMCQPVGMAYYHTMPPMMIGQPPAHAHPQMHHQGTPTKSPYQPQYLSPPSNAGPSVPTSPSQPPPPLTLPVLLLRHTS